MKKLVELEYLFHTSPKILFPRLSTSNGLMGWFADKVQQEKDIFVFYWDKISHSARQVQLIENVSVRYVWLDESGYFEFKVSYNEMTGMTTLWVREYTDEDEVETATELWNAQVARLRRMLGC